MKKRVAVTLLCVLTMAALALAGCSVGIDGPAGGADIKDELTGTVPALIPTDFSQTYTDTDGTALVEYTCTMPQIENLGQRDAWAKINDAFRAAVEEDILEITVPETGYVSDAQAERQYLAEHPDIGRDFRLYTIERTYAETLNDGETLSIKTDYYINTGGAHPNKMIGGMTFDALSGQKLELGDMFTGEGWEQTVIDEVLAQIKAGDKEEYLFEEYEETIKAYDYANACWYLGSDGVHLIFNDYEIAPYAAGPQEFIIPTV